MNEALGKRDLKRILSVRLDQLVHVPKFFDDTGFSTLGHCLHVEVDREDGLIKYDLYGNVVAQARITTGGVGDIEVVDKKVWDEDELGLDTLIECTCDCMGISPREMYNI
ncbi:hypothetical protein PA10_00187 [Pseudomonas phage pPa_SNUABM_DT01]|nr:hypothetical protein PA10_00187 [Pseudomonas phage pPa_SNUABM_DT01]